MWPEAVWFDTCPRLLCMTIGTGYQTLELSLSGSTPWPLSHPLNFCLSLIDRNVYSEQLIKTVWLIKYVDHSWVTIYLLHAGPGLKLCFTLSIPPFIATHWWQCIVPSLDTQAAKITIFIHGWYSVRRYIQVSCIMIYSQLDAKLITHILYFLDIVTPCLRLLHHVTISIPSVSFFHSPFMSMTVVQVNCLCYNSRINHNRYGSLV